MVNFDKKAKEIYREIEKSELGDIVSVDIASPSSLQESQGNKLLFFKMDKDLFERWSASRLTMVVEGGFNGKFEDEYLISLPDPISPISDALLGDQNHLNKMNQIIWDAIKEEKDGKEIIQREVVIQRILNESSGYESIFLNKPFLDDHYNNCKLFSIISSPETRMIARPGLNRQTYSINSNNLRVQRIGMKSDGSYDFSLLSGIDVNLYHFKEVLTVATSPEQRIDQDVLSDLLRSSSLILENRFANSALMCDDLSREIKILEQLDPGMGILHWEENAYIENMASTHLDNGLTLTVTDNTALIDLILADSKIRQSLNLKTAGHIMVNDTPIHMIITDTGASKEWSPFIPVSLPDMASVALEAPDEINNYETLALNYIAKMKEPDGNYWSHDATRFALLSEPEFSKESLVKDFETLLTLRNNNIPDQSPSPVYPYHFVQTENGAKLTFPDFLDSASRNLERKHVSGPEISNEFRKLVFNIEPVVEKTATRKAPGFEV